MSRLTKGYLIGFAAITVWSTTGILIGYLIDHYDMPALLLSLWRNIFVCVALVPGIYMARRSLLRIKKSQAQFFVFYGLILAVFNSIWTLSVQENGAGVATVLGYSSAGFTAIFAWWFFKERLGLFKIVAVSLSLTGCVLVANAYDPEMWHLKPLGIITGILSGVLFASYNMMAKESTERHISPWTSLLYSFAFGSVFILIFNFLPLPGAAGSAKALMPDLPMDGWFILILLSFIPTVFGYGLYNVSMHYLPASVASLIATTEPLMTAVEAYILLDERMSLIQVLGSLLILVGVVVVRFEKEQTPVIVPREALNQTEFNFES